MNQEYRPTIPPTRRPAAWTRYWPFAVPVVWCVLVLAVMRPDAICWREDLVPFQTKCLIYDECDLTAISVRGANAAMGRLPGDRHDIPFGDEIELAERLDGPPLPYKDRFYLEYPTPALGFFWLGYAVQPDGLKVELPAAVADWSHQFGVGYFIPRDETERAIWLRLRWACRFYLCAMTAAALAMMWAIGRGYEPGQGWHPALWLLALPGVVYFSLNRFDILPAVATAMAFLCLGRGHRGWSGAWLAAGVLLKLYPVLFVPVILRSLGVKAGVHWLAGFTATAAAGLGLSVALTDWEATIRPVLVQMARTLEVEDRTLYGRLLPEALAHSKLGRQAILVAAVLAAVAVRPKDLSGVLRRCAIVLIVFVNLAVFWSPQWMVWFVPLLVPLVRTSRRYLWPLIALDLVSYWSFPIFVWISYPALNDTGQAVFSELTIALRTLCWGWLLILLLVHEWRPPRAVANVANAIQAFEENRASLLVECLRIGSESGSPRGLKWISLDPTGGVAFVRDRDSGGILALAPARVRFEPLAGSDLEDVPQAREPRDVVAMFAFENGEWRTAGRVVFNLTAAQVIERSGGRYEKVSS